MALRYWLFLIPWLVGGLFGLGEGIVAYPREVALDLGLRVGIHASSAAWSVLATLVVWRRFDAGPGGAILGGLAGSAAHIGFNLTAWISGSLAIPLWGQGAYLGALLLLGILGLALVVRHEPSSDEALRFLAIPGRG